MSCVTGLEYVEQDTFGRLSWIIPIAAVMMLADFLFFALVYSSPGGNLITAQVGLASSVIALTLSTALLYLLRTIVDGAILRVEALNLSLSRFVPAEFLRLLNRQSVEQNFTRRKQRSHDECSVL